MRPSYLRSLDLKKKKRTVVNKLRQQEDSSNNSILTDVFEGYELCDPGEILYFSFTKGYVGQIVAARLCNRYQ